jgi:hypothetical protein
VVCLCLCKRRDWCESEKRKKRVSENRVLRRIFGLKMSRIVRGGWTKLNNEELHTSPITILG